MSPGVVVDKHRHIARAAWKGSGPDECEFDRVFKTRLRA